MGGVLDVRDCTGCGGRRGIAMIINRRMSFRARIILHITGVTMLMVGVLAIVNIFQLREVLTHTAKDRLETEALQMADRFETLFQNLENDSVILSGVPPVQNMMRSAREQDGQDGANAPDYVAARILLEDIFAAVLQVRPDYNQLRYIGFADNGQELVRIDRRGDGIFVTPPGDLQQKGAEPYLLNAKALKSEEYLISRVSRNVEGGRTDLSQPLTLRLVRLVEDDLGQPFGVIVINADYFSLLRGAMPNGLRSLRLTALNAAGDALIQEPGENEMRVIAHDLEQTGRSDLTLNFAGLPREVTFANDMASILVDVPVGTSHSGLTLGLLASRPIPVVMAEVNATILRSIAVSTVLLVVAVLGAWVVASALAEPLRKLTRVINQRKTNNEGIILPTEGHDEIAQLAQAFEALGNQIIGQSRKARAILQAAPDGILTLDNSGIITEVNPALARMFGYASDELTGGHGDILIPDQFVALYRDHLANGDAQRQLAPVAAARDISGRRKNGQKFAIEVSFSSFESDGIQSVAAIVRDVTDRNKREEELQVLVAALERSNAELDSFAYVASHDLKAPLRVIDNASQWIEADLAEHFDDDTRESMDLLRGRIKRMERLLDDLLQHSRIGRIDQAVQLAPGKALIEDIVMLLPPSDGFVIDVSPAFGDITLPMLPLRTILLNLVSNAIKHHDRSVGRITLSVTDGPDWMRFGVADDGPGIPSEYHTRVLAMFQTLRPRDQVEGSGMGLAMVKKHVEVLGGTLTIESDGSRGATFWVEIPKYWTRPTQEEEAA